MNKIKLLQCYSASVSATTSSNLNLRCHEMDFLYYQRKINDVIEKCPIETGVEILVYNLLDKCVDSNNFSLVDINSIWKNQDIRLTTDGGISDIAILSTDFKFGEEDKGNVYGFVEVKPSRVTLTDSEQVSKQMKKVNHYIYTNGIVWKYFLNQTLKWEINLSNGEFSYAIKKIYINESKFTELKNALQKIEWST